MTSLEGTGSVLREIRELEEQVEAEQKKNMEKNLSRITNDLKMIKTENQGMIQSLKSWIEKRNRVFKHWQRLGR